MKTTYILCRDLLDYLHDFGIYTLSHAHNYGVGPVSSSYWLTVEDLDLDGVWKEEWKRYIGGLSHGGIKLSL